MVTFAKENDGTEILVYKTCHCAKIVNSHYINCGNFSKSARTTYSVNRKKLHCDNIWNGRNFSGALNFL